MSHKDYAKIIITLEGALRLFMQKHFKVDNKESDRKVSGQIVWIVTWVHSTQLLTTQSFNVWLKLLAGAFWVACVYSHVTNVQFNTDFSVSAGYVCERKDLLVNGCCNVNAPSSSQHVCKSCLANGCCSIYEYCVSCCLQPDKVLQTTYLYLVLLHKSFRVSEL